MRLFFKVLGIVLVVLGSMTLLGTLAEAGEGKPSGGVGVSLAMVGGGLLLVRKARRMKRAEPETRQAVLPTGPTIEQRTLAVARKFRGQLTAVQMAAESGVTIEQARVELERLAKENACLMDVEADGRIVFRFPEFAASDDRRSS